MSERDDCKTCDGCGQVEEHTDGSFSRYLPCPDCIDDAGYSLPEEFDDDGTQDFTEGDVIT